MAIAEIKASDLEYPPGHRVRSGSSGKFIYCVERFDGAWRWALCGWLKGGEDEPQLLEGVYHSLEVRTMSDVTASKLTKLSERRKGNG